ncbi:hypothetical protein GUJ93_ZPchr0006g43597 [Zizania palustris]|uniref:Reverse transcriptase zinc-binding domain-containing protein n=1 Tax=Zizania palustris TaxID=103762 RepID=A0A8J5SG47_ZIZPA|nr:hypothetical protein GUJ93_ZPchr0006g43597 [Zizania palustris]
MFFLPLSEQAQEEFDQLKEKIQSLNPTEQEQDNWSYIWGLSKYTPKKYYNYTYSSIEAHPIFKWIWACQCEKKIKLFSWFMVNDRLHTKDILCRKNLLYDNGDYNCILCGHGILENVLHLFVDCQFSKRCWARMDIVWPINGSLEERIAALKSNDDRSFAMELILIGAWSLWLHRNNCIFRQNISSLQQWWASFLAILKIQTYRQKEDTKEKNLSLDS